MKKKPQLDVVRKLADNATDIIAACTDGQPERLSMLANRQKFLTETLDSAFSKAGEGTSNEVRELRVLVEKAIDAVKVEMGLNRGNMQATGIKKKVLSAYGTVTVAGTDTR
jgi:hypothetical protein